MSVRTFPLLEVALNGSRDLEHSPAEEIERRRRMADTPDGPEAPAGR